MALHRHKRHDGLAGGRVRCTDDGGLGHARMADQGVLDLRRRDAVSRDVHDVVDSAQQPQVAVFVLLRTVAREVRTGETGPVRLLVAFRVAPDPPQHSRPWLGEKQEPGFAVADRRAVIVNHFSTDPRQRPHGRAGLGGGDPWQRRDHDPAGFGLPPGVDDRAAVAPNVLAIPHPRLRVDGLADRAEKPKARKVMGVGVFLSPLHERANGGGGGVEDGHLVLVDDAPPAVAPSGVGSPLVHHRGGPVGQGSVDDVTVPGDPPDVRCRPEDVCLRLEIEDQAVGGRGVD